MAREVRGLEICWARQLFLAAGDPDNLSHLQVG